VVAALGLVVITNDRRIRIRPGEADVARDADLRCVHLRPRAKTRRRWPHFPGCSASTLTSRNVIS
ncbi:MAG: hypothetical protein ACRDRK_26800, partial [Pseudonocardia sp.]